MFETKTLALLAAAAFCLNDPRISAQASELGGKITHDCMHTSEEFGLADMSSKSKA